MLSFRLFLEDSDVVAGLNMYSLQPDAFDETARTVGLLLATHGALAVAAIASQHGNRKVADLAADVADTGQLPCHGPHRPGAPELSGDERLSPVAAARLTVEVETRARR
jgi:hypothetical protein